MAPRRGRKGKEKESRDSFDQQYSGHNDQTHGQGHYDPAQDDDADNWYGRLDYWQWVPWGEPYSQIIKWNRQMQHFELQGVYADRTCDEQSQIQTDEIYGYAFLWSMEPADARRHMRALANGQTSTPHHPVRQPRAGQAPQVSTGHNAQSLASPPPPRADLQAGQPQHQAHPQPQPREQPQPQQGQSVPQPASSAESQPGVPTSTQGAEDETGSVTYIQRYRQLIPGTPLDAKRKDSIDRQADLSARSASESNQALEERESLLAENKKQREDIDRQQQAIDTILQRLDAVAAPTHDNRNHRAGGGQQRPDRNDSRRANAAQHAPRTRGQPHNDAGGAPVHGRLAQGYPAFIGVDTTRRVLGVSDSDSE